MALEDIHLPLRRIRIDIIRGSYNGLHCMEALVGYPSTWNMH